MCAESASPAVVVCGDLGGAGRVDAGAVADRLRARFRGLAVSVIADACGDRPALRAALAGADRAVLGLCVPPDVAQIQAVARGVGIDPLAVETVALAGAVSDASAARLLAGAVARSRRYRRSRPENLVPRVPRRRTRRSLLSLGAIVYEAVPCVDARRCAVRTGCTICVRACPLGALARVDARLDLDRSRCTGCAVCVAACPSDAITLPTHTDERLQATIAALLDTTDGDASPRTITFVCRSATGRSDGTAEGSSLPVEVPCLGALSPDWPLRCLVGGASDVVLVGCGDCPSDTTVRRGTAWCRALLDRAGLADRLRLPRESERGDGAADTPPSPTAPSATVAPSFASSIVALLSARGGDALDDLAHPGSPFGMVSVRAEKCTLCGSCAAACPSTALALGGGADEVALTFDHARCVACGLCAAACPEGPDVLTLSRVTSPRALARRRAELHRDARSRCASCGEAIAPRRLLARVASMLADQPQVVALLERQCQACRDHASGALG